MSLINQGLFIVIAIATGFLLISTIVLPFFAPAYNYCQSPVWRPDEGSSYTNCTQRFCDDRNTSKVTGASTYTGCGITAPTENALASAWCLNCNTRGGYWTTNTALMLIILVIGLIGFAFRFLPRFK